VAACRGQTPLHWAAEKGHVSVVELLMTSGASVEAEDAFGRDPRAAATKLWEGLDVDPNHGLLIRGYSSNSHNMILKWYLPN